MKTRKEYEKDFKREVKKYVLEKSLHGMLVEPLDDTLVMLRAMRNKYDKDYDGLCLEIDAESHGYYESSGVTIYVRLIGKRMETAVEFDKRIDTSYAQYQRLEDKRRAEYEKLKNVYGKE